MKQYRYVVNGKAREWRSLDTTIALMNYIADSFNEQFGDNWYIEYKEGDEESVSI